MKPPGRAGRGTWPPSERKSGGRKGLRAARPHQTLPASGGGHRFIAHVLSMHSTLGSFGVPFLCPPRLPHLEAMRTNTSIRTSSASKTIVSMIVTLLVAILVTIVALP